MFAQLAAKGLSGTEVHIRGSRGSRRKFGMQGGQAHFQLMRKRARTFPLWCERKARLHRVSSLDYVVGIRHCHYFIKFFQQNKENYSKKIRHSNINTRPNEEESAGLSHTSMHTQQQRPDWFPYLALVRLRGAAAFVALWVCVGRRGVCAQVGLRGQASAVLLTAW